MERNPNKILSRDSRSLQRVIGDSIRVKADVVSADEKESGLRRILNFGHTIGHALESATDYSHFLHGEAVGWGMIAASFLASLAGFCTPEAARQIEAATLAYGPLPPVPCSADEVLRRLSSDKKTIGGNVHFIVPRRIGKVAITNAISPELVRRAVEKITSHA